MRQIGDLIDEVIFNCNIEKSQKFTEASLIRIFNAAQRSIRMVIHNAFPTEPILAKIQTYSITTGTTFLTLPSDILTPNAVHNVTPIRINGAYGESIQRISLIERSNSYGYYIVNDKLYMNPSDYFERYNNSQIEVTYASELATLTATTDISELPTVCEEYMILWAERKINHIKSSKDTPNSKVFSDDERKDIVELFASAARDPKIPPAYNSDYLAY